jgi:glycosyltransferase involved in cell wall biosynthesis
MTIISFEKRERFVQNRKLIEDICKENHIQWEPIPYHKFPPVFSTLYDLWRLRRKVEDLHSVNKLAIIHCRSYITSLVGLFMKKKYGIKFLFDMRGFWADERIEGGLWNRENIIYGLVYRYFKKKEREFVLFADHIVSLTYKAKNEILSWGNVPAPITVIPTCVDLELFDPSKVSDAEKIALKKQLNMNPSDFVLLYLGSWGSWYLTDEMLSYFLEIKKSDKSAKLLIITPDVVHLEDYELKNDVVICSSPRASVPLFISISNAAVFFIKPSYSKMASSATKLGEIMAMNVPVITNLGWGDVEKIVENTNGMITTVNTDDFTSSKKIIPVNSRQYCSEELSLECGVENYRNIYLELMKSHASMK